MRALSWIGRGLSVAALVGCGNTSPGFYNASLADGEGAARSPRFEGPSADALPAPTAVYQVQRHRDLSLNGHFGIEDAEIELAMVKGPAYVSEIEQIDREQASIEVVQGHDGYSASETFDLWELGRLNLLVVVDNSNSMRIYQERLSEGLGNLIEHIENVNWRIGVVTTDSHCIRDMITRDEFNRDPIETNRRFMEAINAGIFGIPVERGIEMAAKGFYPDAECPVAGNQWTQEDARHAVLLLSDEENCGSGIFDRCDTDKWGRMEHWTPDRFIASAPAETRVYGLLHDEEKCGFMGYDFQPEEYYNLIPRTGGLWKEICQDDYSGVLGTISEDIGRMVVRKFRLQEPPEPGSVQAVIDQSPQALEVEIVGNEIILPSLESSAESVVIQYRHSARPRFTDITLEGSHDPQTLEILINGRTLDVSQYSYEYGKINFPHSVVDRAQVEVKYRRAGELLTRFVAGDYPCWSDTLSVWMDDQPLNDYSYEGGVIQVETAPKDGSNIRLQCWKEDSIETEYALGQAQERILGDIKIFAGEQEINRNYVLDGDRLVLDPRLVGEHERLKLRIPRRLLDNELRLPAPVNLEAPYAVLSAFNGSCPEQIPVEDGTVDLSCLGPTGGEVKVHFKVVVDDFHRFPLRREFLGVAKDQLKVSCNGADIDFEVSAGDLIVDPDFLNDGDVIRVTLIEDEV